MHEPIKIRMGGYGPPTTSFSRALKLIGDTLAAAFGDRISVNYVWNIMDFGYRAEEILTLVEDGILTLGYQSSSYLTDRVPELGFVDLPFLFDHRDRARAAIDGALGEFQSGLGERWRDTAIVVATEFGRTARINGTEGTDHGTADRKSTRLNSSH